MAQIQLSCCRGAVADLLLKKSGPIVAMTTESDVRASSQRHCYIE